MKPVCDRTKGVSIRGGASGRIAETWAKPGDDENVEMARAVGEVCRRLHRQGYTDLDIANLVSRSGRHLGVWTVRAWREAHRANTISAADALRLVSVVDAWCARPLLELFMRRAGMVAVDLPELAAPAASLERGALVLGGEFGELQRCIAEAALDGELSAAERSRIAEEARDVVREAAHLERSAGGVPS